MDMLLTTNKVPICPISDVDISVYYDNISHIGQHVAVYKLNVGQLPNFNRSWTPERNMLSRCETWYPATISGELVGHMRDDELYFSGDRCNVRVAKTGQTMPLSSYRRCFMRAQRKKINN
jgi:hypothetical protein